MWVVHQNLTVITRPPLFCFPYLASTTMQFPCMTLKAWATGRRLIRTWMQNQRMNWVMDIRSRETCFDSYLAITIRRTFKVSRGFKPELVLWMLTTRIEIRYKRFDSHKFSEALLGSNHFIRHRQKPPVPWWTFNVAFFLRFLFLRGSCWGQSQPRVSLRSGRMPHVACFVESPINGASRDSGTGSSARRALSAAMGAAARSTRMMASWSARL